MYMRNSQHKVMLIFLAKQELLEICFEQSVNLVEGQTI
jgi:hypothetical protein